MLHKKLISSGRKEKGGAKLGENGTLEAGANKAIGGKSMTKKNLFGLDE